MIPLSVSLPLLMVNGFTPPDIVPSGFMVKISSLAGLAGAGDGVGAESS